MSLRETEKHYHDCEIMKQLREESLRIDCHFMRGEEELFQVMMQQIPCVGDIVSVEFSSYSANAWNEDARKALEDASGNKFLVKSIEHNVFIGRPMNLPNHTVWIQVEKKSWKHPMKKANTARMAA